MSDADAFEADARAARHELERLLETDAPALLATLPAAFALAAEAMRAARWRSTSGST